MRRVLIATLVAEAFIGVGRCGAQVATGEIYGRLTDDTGGVLPGASATLTGPALLQPQVARTTATGTYRFATIPVGAYSLRFEMAGFRTIVRDGIRVEVGRGTRINATMSIGGIDETVQVSAASPLVDTTNAGTGTRFTREALQAVPSARDPWVIMEQSAGVAVDRQNVGGSASGQQSSTVSRGAFGDSKWNVDGVDITDLSTYGGSPYYYDFDSFEEILITTGGADVTMQSAGLEVTMVTKSGTDRIRGSGRLYITDDTFEADNITTALRRAGASGGNPIRNIRDYGIEAGGPLVKERAWIWGSYGTQRVDVGVNSFYKPDAACQALKTNPLNYSRQEVRACLNPDRTVIESGNLKVAVQASRRDQLSFSFNVADKIRNARDASDLRPLETTVRQSGVARSDLGSRWWTTGPPKTYRWATRHVFNDRLLIEGLVAHVGNNFAATFHDESLRAVQPALEITTSAWSRSYSETVNVRPTDSIDVTGHWFLPGRLGGDHALKFGAKYRNDGSYVASMYGGDAIARFLNGVPVEAELRRRSIVDGVVENRSLYVQDRVTVGRVTFNAGFRVDHQDDRVSAATVPSSPFYGQATYAGLLNGTTYGGQLFLQLPSVRFAGFDPEVAFTNVSPRLGMSVDLAGDASTLAKVYYARYVGQLGGPIVAGTGVGALALVYNPVVATSVRYPWVDVNGDRFIQANEIVVTQTPLSWTSGYDYANPSRITTSGTVDPALSADVSDEILVSLDRQWLTDLAVGASYIWRRYGNYRWSDRVGWTSADYVPVVYQPTGCPSGGRCDAVTYYAPRSAIPVSYVFTNWPDYRRSFHGAEVSLRKRMSKGWQMNASLTWNDAHVHFGSTDAYEDPTNIDRLDNAQFAPESTSSGLGNVFVNAPWIFRVSGSWRLPVWDLDLAGFYNSRSGYPFVANVQTPSRPNGGGIANVYLDRLGDRRLETFRDLDLRVGRRVACGRLSLILSIDVFNLLNSNTPLSRRPVQNATNANQVSSILAPRIVRIGARVEW